MTGCPVLSVRLLGLISLAPIAEAIFKSEVSPTGSFEFKIADSNIGQSFSFYPEITFGSSASNSFVN